VLTFVALVGIVGIVALINELINATEKM